MSSEDMDSLTFGAPRVLRNLMTPASAKLPVQEYDYAKVLEELALTEDQFVDLCILCGCDYAGTIRGIGPKSALNLIRTHGTIEKVLEHIDRAKYPVPEPFPFEQARKLFKGKKKFFFLGRSFEKKLFLLFFFFFLNPTSPPTPLNQPTNPQPTQSPASPLSTSFPPSSSPSPTSKGSSSSWSARRTLTRGASAAR